MQQTQNLSDAIRSMEKEKTNNLSQRQAQDVTLKKLQFYVSGRVNDETFICS